MIVETNIKVFTFPMWLYEQYKGLKHPTKKDTYLNLRIDPDGDPIISKESITDEDWAYLGENPIVSPDGESRHVLEWFTEKNYKYHEQTEIDQ